MARQLYINGRWEEPVAGKTFSTLNPATEEVVEDVAAATAGDIDRAVTAARAAFEDSWSRTSGKERAAFLRMFSRAILDRKPALARMEVEDNGKPLPEADWDIDDAAACFAYYADLAEELDGAREAAIELPDSRFRCHVRHEPVGVAGQIIPWNYPLLMAAWKVAPALAAGCTSVLKPSEFTPLTALELASIAHEIGLPRGVLNIVTGTGMDAGDPLARHPGVDKVAFTGSIPTGVKVIVAGAQDVKNVSLELGGKSPIVVFDDADLDQAVEWILFGIFWNQGEVCSATSRLIVQRGIAERLLDRLVEGARRIPIGNGLTPGVLLGPLVSASQHAKVMHYIASGCRSGATLLCGGNRPQHLNRGYFVEPTIFADVPEDAPIWNEEIFGPVLCVRRFETETEAVRISNATPFGLAAAVMSGDRDRCARMAAAFRAGIVWVNCSQPTFVQAPWGGMKKSGVGRELGRWGLNSYLEVKQVTSYVSDEPWGWYSKRPS